MDQTTLTFGTAYLSEDQIADRIEESLKNYRRDKNFEALAGSCTLALAKAVLKHDFNGDPFKMNEAWRNEHQTISLQPQIA